ncbi:MAG: type II toxin-antitoxin system PrlF family antitoxin [Sulfuricella sp.]|nr:type II toxin-antitoxin system PrlF family antitoxin [Sulfuricella sp.]
MTTHTEAYPGKVAAIGNSRGIRLDAAFFRAHPEFSGEVTATVVADGHVLLSAKNPAQEEPAADPVLGSFLTFLGKEMQAHPELILPADQGLLAEIAELVEGVE